MTNREFYNAIISNESLNAEIREFAETAISKLDSKNANRKPSKESVAAQARRDFALSIMEQNTVYNRNQLAELMDCTPAQATAAMTYLVKEGKVTKAEAKGEKGSIMTYTLA